jgi:hypothetical protein
MAPLSLIRHLQSANSPVLLVFNPYLPWKSDSRCFHPFRFTVDWIGAAVAPQICPPHSCIHFRSFNISYCISSCQSELAPRVYLPRSSDIIQVTLWVLSEGSSLMGSVRFKIQLWSQKSTVGQLKRKWPGNDLSYFQNVNLEGAKVCSWAVMLARRAEWVA